MKPPVSAFVVGFPKCGTTWLATNLAAHPYILHSSPKEANWLAGAAHPSTIGSEWSQYAEFFGPESSWDGQVLVDGSVTMACDWPLAIEHVKRHYPDAKILAMVREPVARDYSDFWHTNRLLHDAQYGPDDFLDKAAEWRLMHRSEYANHLRPWLRGFDETLVVLAEEAWDEPKAALRRIYEFLGVDGSFAPRKAAKARVPPDRDGTLEVRANAAAQRLRRRGMGFLVDAAVKVGARRWVSRRTRANHAYPPLPDEARAAHARWHRDGIIELESLLGRSVWERPMEVVGRES